MRWTASSFEEFRRITSAVCTLVIVSSIPLTIIFYPIPDDRAIRLCLTSLYFILAVILKLALRPNLSRPQRAVGLVQLVFFVVGGISGLYLVDKALSQDDVEEVVLFSAINFPAFIALVLIIQRNISKAKLMASDIGAASKNRSG